MACGVAAALTAVTVALEEPRRTSLLSRIPSGGDVLMVGAPIKEKATGIMFPQLCNGINLVGMYFYSFRSMLLARTWIQLHWIGGIKNQSTQVLEKVLLIPFYPRMIHIVMNCALSIDKYMSAIVEALEPRMNGTCRLGNSSKCW
jgi:cytochrome bd-type quinol oxidase subunit 2